MATKTISITEEAYERLSTKKLGSESFSEVINRITNKTSLLAFSGLLNINEAESIKEKIRKSRALSKKRMRKITL